MQWKHPSSAPLKKAKVVSSAGKLVTSVNWNQRALCSLTTFRKGENVNGEYHAKLLRQLRKAIKSKRPGKLRKGVLLHPDNAPAHRSVVAMAAVLDCGFELTLVDHPPYSPDLGPSDYFLFPNRKKQTTRSYLQTLFFFFLFSEDQDESFYTTGIRALQHRWKVWGPQGRLY